MANARIFTQKDFEEWGRIGGGNARGEAKKRSAAHYKRIAQLGVEGRKRKALERAKVA